MSMARHSPESKADESFDCDEIEELISADNQTDESVAENRSAIPSNDKLASQLCRVSCISQAQKTSLSLEKSMASVSDSMESDSGSKSRVSLSTVKTSSIPGPVGLLPILKTSEDLRRLKEDKVARDTVLTNEEHVNAKRPKTSGDLFSLNICNYPSYAIALQQLHESFSCEPISIHTALVKTRLGIKKRIPLMCAAVTHYDRQENTILLDKSGHIRATFIGDDEVLDSFNIRVGHTLVLRNVAVFTSTRQRHHYVNIHLQNIIAIQDPLCDMFNMPSTSHERPSKSPLNSLENEISAYEDASKSNNETFHLFSQPDRDENEQPPLKKMNTHLKSSTNSAFNHVKPRAPSPTANKFHVTTASKPSMPPPPPPPPSLPPTPVTVTSPPPVPAGELLQIVDKPIDANLNVDEIVDDEFFSSW